MSGRLEGYSTALGWQLRNISLLKLL